MEAFELLVAACFVQTHNVYVFTQTWTRSFRVRPRVGRSRSRDGRVSPSNIYICIKVWRERSACMDLYTRESGKVGCIIYGPRERRGGRELSGDRGRHPPLAQSQEPISFSLSLSFSSSPYPFSVRPSCERYAPSRMPCHPGEKNNISL